MEQAQERESRDRGLNVKPLPPTSLAWQPLSPGGLAALAQPLLWQLQGLWLREVFSLSTQGWVALLSFFNTCLTLVYVLAVLE